MARAPTYFEHNEAAQRIVSFDLVEPDAELLRDDSIEVREREITPAQFQRLVHQTYGTPAPTLTLVRKTPCITR